MERDKAIYWAGFFDGEGSVDLNYVNPTRINPYGRYHFQVMIRQVIRGNASEFFNDLLLEFGGAIKKVSSIHPDVYIWYVHGIQARHFLQTILPYLRKQRKAAELGIELSKRLTNFRLPRVGTDAIIEEVNKRDAILQQFYDLPKRDKSKRKCGLGRDYLAVRLKGCHRD